MIKTFANIYKNYVIPFEEAMAEIYYVLDIEFNLPKQEILRGKELSATDFQKACKIFEQRITTQKPIQYIIKKAIFMNDIFDVDENVLIPRDDTQILTEETITLIKKHNLKKILEIGTGSGIIAIETAKNCPSAQIFAIDISENALNIAKKNAQKFKTKIKFINSDLFANIENKFDLIVSNPPYIPVEEKENLQFEVKTFEPHIALFAEENGLTFYKKIIHQAPDYLMPNGFLAFETGINQAEEIRKFMKAKFKNISVKKDVSGIERVISGQLN